MSIRSREKSNIFEVEPNDIPETSEPFKTEVSMISDSSQYKPKITVFKNFKINPDGNLDQEFSVFLSKYCGPSKFVDGLGLSSILEH